MNSSRPDRSILVIDDDADIVEVLSVVLTGAGYRVMTAANGMEGLEVLRSQPPPDIILLDLMMPIMNAWEFRQEQLRDASLESIPVVVMTGFNRATDEAASLGAVDLLKKPVELETLLASIARALGDTQPRLRVESHHPPGP